MREELESFYREKDPARRREMIRDLVSSAGQDAADIRLAARLFELRYGRNGSTEADYFVRHMLTLMSISRAPSIFTGHQKRQTEKVIKDLGITETEEQIASGVIAREEAEEILYREFLSAADLYFSTCTEESYHRLFGMAASSENTRAASMKQDAADMGSAVADRFHLEEPLRVWCRAVEDAALARM